MSYLSQMAGLAVQNFVSAAVGMAVLAAVVRGIWRRARAADLGNFWRDLYRSLVYILLPLSVIVAVLLISQGVPQTFDGHATATTLQGAQQTIARGPVASQIAIKQLGTNGGGFYNSNSAVPFENPTGPLELRRDDRHPAHPGRPRCSCSAGWCCARRHAWMVFAAMFAMFAIGVGVNLTGRAARLAGAAQLGRQPRASTRPERRQHGRQGSTLRHRRHVPSGPWPTTDASNGSVNSGFDAQTPAGGAVPLVNLFLGEVIFGGVGSGL